MARRERPKSKGRAFQKEVLDAAGTVDWNRKHPGQPSMYHDNFCHLVEVLTLVGGILDDVAQLLGTTISTIDLWMVSHPNFSGAIKTARKRADEAVVRSLHSRAIGYSHPAVKIFNDEGRPMIVPYIEHYPPEVTADIFWLANRDPSNWRRGDPDAGAGVSSEEMKRLLREQLQEMDDAEPSAEELSTKETKGSK